MAKIHEPQMTRFTLLAADCASDDGIKTSLAADGADFTFVAPQIDPDFIFTSRRWRRFHFYTPPIDADLLQLGGTANCVRRRAFVPS